MNAPSATTGQVELYSRTARNFHWAIVALILVQAPVGAYMAYRGNTLKIWDAVTGGLYTSHKLLGVTILAVVVCRLAYRLTHGIPAAEPTLTAWQRVASRLNHWGLYILLLCVPIAGYIGISLYPALDILGQFSLPAVVEPNREASDTAFLVHRLLGRLLVLLVAIHVAAALFHHFIRKDNVLARMLPRLLRH